MDRRISGGRRRCFILQGLRVDGRFMVTILHSVRFVHKSVPKRCFCLAWCDWLCRSLPSEKYDTRETQGQHEVHHRQTNPSIHEWRGSCGSTPLTAAVAILSNKGGGVTCRPYQFPVLIGQTHRRKDLQSTKSIPVPIVPRKVTETALVRNKQHWYQPWIA